MLRYLDGPENAQRRLMRNILLNQAGFLVSAVATFLVSPYVVNGLGPARYGVWTLIMSLTGNYGLIAFGIQGAMTRYITHASAKCDHDAVNGYFNTALSFLLASASIILVVGVVISLHVENLFVIPAELVREAELASFLVTLSVVSTLLFSVFDCVLIAHERFDVTSAIGMSAVIIRSVLTIAFLKADLGLVALAALSASLSCVSGTLSCATVLRKFPSLRVSLPLARKECLRDLARYGKKSFTVAVSINLIYQCDLLVVGSSLSMEQVAVYSIAGTLIMYLVQFVNAISSAFDPYITRTYSLHGMDGVRELFLRGSSAMYILGGIVVSGMLVFGEDFFTLWLGTGYGRCAAVLTFLALPQFFAIGARVGRSVLVATAGIGPLALASICEGVGNIALSLFLAGRYGVAGVAMGTAVPAILNHGVWFHSYISRVCRIPAWGFLLTCVLPGLIVGAATFAFAGWVRELWQPVSWGAFLVKIGLVAFPGGVIAASCLFAWKPAALFIPRLLKSARRS